MSLIFTTGEFRQTISLCRVVCLIGMYQIKATFPSRVRSIFELRLLLKVQSIKHCHSPQECSGWCCCGAVISIHYVIVMQPTCRLRSCVGANTSWEPIGGCEDLCLNNGPSWTAVMSICSPPVLPSLMISLENRCQALGQGAWRIGEEIHILNRTGHSVLSVGEILATIKPYSCKRLL